MCESIQKHDNSCTLCGRKYNQDLIGITLRVLRAQRGRLVRKSDAVVIYELFEDIVRDLCLNRSRNTSNRVEAVDGRPIKTLTTLLRVLRAQRDRFAARSDAGVISGLFENILRDLCLNRARNTSNRVDAVHGRQIKTFATLLRVCVRKEI